MPASRKHVIRIGATQNRTRCVDSDVVLSGSTGVLVDGTSGLSLQDPEGTVTSCLTSATERDGWLWLGAFIHGDLKRLLVPARPG